jgi:activating signal cointegrator complex subunit 3
MCIVELTGESSPSPDLLRKADILCTTPEKWDGTSRQVNFFFDTFITLTLHLQWHARAYVRQTQLVILDEIHLLGQDRGPILEVIVSRMRYISTQTGIPVRIIGSPPSLPLLPHRYCILMWLCSGLSTALANANDVASWIGVPKHGLYNFRPSVRPVPLEIHIQGVHGQHYCPRMATMNKPAYAAICLHSREKPVLVFVASRRQTRVTALALISLAAADETAPSFHKMTEAQIKKVVDTLSDSALRHVIPFGIGIHHAGLPPKDKVIVEELFKSGKIQVCFSIRLSPEAVLNCSLQVLVCTATLAWGVNLPAHLVIIKGTEYFDGKTKRYVDMPITDVLQMMGRAGRPQYDTSGTAVILVHSPKKPFYTKVDFPSRYLFVN